MTETKKAEKKKETPSVGYATRGSQFQGIVVSTKMQKTATVRIEHVRKIQKYDRLEKRSKKVAAHNPESINAKQGDLVLIQECRPISKTKSFIITKVVSHG
ncbi:MAG: 30S ribosomal protein S17 [archaeon]